jgi:uncharacterized damage-inducible protein DinB
MLKANWQSLARYNRWMNEKVYNAAAELTETQQKADQGAFFKSIHNTLNHILLADRIWLGRFTGTPLEPGCIGPGGIRTLDQVLYSDFSELRAAHAATANELEQWITELSTQRISGTLQFLRGGALSECPLWWAVTHLFNHQTHHRGQITTMLVQAGRDVGATDLVAMLRADMPQT